MTTAQDSDTTFAALARALADRVDHLSEVLLARVFREIPEWLERPELHEPLRQLTRESVRVEQMAFARRELPDECPAVDAEIASWAARLEGPVSLVIDGYRRGHQVQWEGWFELVEGEDCEPELRRELLERGSRFFFAYAGRVSHLAANQYERERDRLLRSREQRRMHLVGELLRGRDVDAGALGYDPSAHHVGVVAWGPQAAQAARELASLVDRRLLAVEVVEETWWAWLGGDRPLDDAAERHLRGYRPPPGARLALGGQRPGAPGFSATHRQAALAHRVALNTQAPLTHHDDVALEGLAGADEDQAREFVARELRGLEGDDARTQQLRDTLAAYLSSGLNAAAAAAALGVHYKTVVHRLAAVEERTGRRVTERRAELEVALRLRRFLDAEGPAPAPGP